MNKFDLVEKISAFDLITRLLKKSRRDPYQLFKNELNVTGKWQENYFNWGRNALYYFFKNLKFKTITFPAFTCPTIVEPAKRAGKKVILSEIDLNTFNLDLNKIPEETECLVVVHTFGNPVDIKRIRKRLKNIYILEDCAHALFSRINNNFTGNSGDAVIFSLYKQVFNINGSLLLTKKRLIQKQKQEFSFKYFKRLVLKTEGPHQYLLNFKRSQYLPSIEPQGLNSDKPSDLVFSLFETGFKKLKKETEKRRKIVNWYYRETEKSEFIISQKPEPDSQPSYYHFAVRLIPELAGIREKVVLELRKRNIFIDRLWYRAPVVQEEYKSFQKKCPKALLLAKTVINLPIHSWYKKKDVEYLFNQLKRVISKLMEKS